MTPVKHYFTKYEQEGCNSILHGPLYSPQLTVVTYTCISDARGKVCLQCEVVFYHNGHHFYIISKHFHNIFFQKVWEIGFSTFQEQNITR